MRFHDKLQLLRKERSFSQEDLAERLSVSRQAISKWESGSALPEIEKLVQLSDIFGVTLDSLMKDGPLQYGRSEHTSERSERTSDRSESTSNPPPMWHRPRWGYEYKSKRTLFGLPLVHVSFRTDKPRAKGIIAIGFIAQGLLSIGLVSIGLLSLGLLSLGLFALGLFSLGLLFSVGTIAVGAVAIGAIAIGIVTLGAVAIGMFSTGALAVASHIAIGHHAYGHIAIGREVAEGARTFLCTSIRDNGMFIVGADEVRAAITEEFPNLWSGIVRWMMAFVR